MGHSKPVNDDLYGIIEAPNIHVVRFGGFDMTAWYGSAVYFGRDRKTLGIRSTSKDSTSRARGSSEKPEIWLEKLYVCDHCFKYTEIQQEYEEHVKVCSLGDKQLGKIMYKDKRVTIRKLRGSKHKLFCQNLCLFTKLFLDNKSMYFSTDLFDFYVVYEDDTNKPMGFFSKELLSPDRNNLACILVFPPYQRRHLGTLLIAFSYELSKAEGFVSGPEKPLSPFGLVGYLRYWSTVICKEFLNGELSGRENVTLEHISEATGIRHDDVIDSLKYMKVLKKVDGTLYLQMSLVQGWATSKKISMTPLIHKDNLVID